MQRFFSTAFIVGLLGTTLWAEVTKVDPGLGAYKPTSGVSGTIKSVGSDTMNNLMALWTADFEKYYTNAKVEVEGKGSSTAPPAMIRGSATFGPMSRPMKAKEQDAFEKAFGYKATQLRVGIDMLAVYVHKDNPVKELTLQQVDAIFSKARKGGHTQEIKTWGELGLGGSWANRPITLYGRNSASGTYSYFKKHALFKGDYKDSVKEQPGSSAVISSLANDITGIGYSGIGYKTSDVRAVPLAARPGKPFVPAVAGSVYRSKDRYPLARFLLLTVNYKPGSKLDPLRAEFIKLVFSKQGQEGVLKDGYLPVTAALAHRELQSVGLSTQKKKAAPSTATEPSRSAAE